MTPSEDGQKLYAMTNVYEFIAESQSNPAVREKLEKLDLWERVKDGIKKILTFYEAAAEFIASPLNTERIRNMGSRNSASLEVLTKVGYIRKSYMPEVDCIFDKFLDSFSPEIYNQRAGSDVSAGMVYNREIEDIEEVNRRFNKELEGLTTTNADMVALSLGRPSEILRAAGVEDKSMKLYGNKVIAKMKKHGFTLNEIRDLPRAVANPIAVFNNYGVDGNRSILTELRTSQGNILVTLKVGVDQDIDFNIISSVFGKHGTNIVDWLNKGLATYINKEKALAFLFYQSAPIAATAAKAELNSAAKVIENFENPKLSGENLQGRDENLYSTSSELREIEEEDGTPLLFRLREEEPPKNTGIGYKVFVLKNGKLYPPMVANPNGADTPTGVWLDADAAPIAGKSKTGRNQVKAGGKGTQGGSGKLAYRPGWHLGEIPYALQFNRNNPETGERELFPANFVWAEVEYANDVDYQDEAMSSCCDLQEN